MRTFLSLLLLALSVLASAVNPITQAMMGVYDKLLAENPKDYDTLFRRANEYYKQGSYDLALKDIGDALNYIPVDNNDLRAQAYSLRANIYLIQGNHDAASRDFTSVIAISPDNYPSLYQKALLDIEAGRLDDATSALRRMQRINPRSADALFGLARVEIKKQNLGIANDLINQAVNLDKTNPSYFLRRADIRKEIGNKGGAVEDILIAISLDSRSHAAFKALTDIAETDYPAVVSGLSDVIAQAPENGMFYYIRATLAMNRGLYSAALPDLQYIIRRNLYDYQGIYRSIAECQYHLHDYSSALENINHAISMTPDNGSYQVLKARILKAMNLKDEAVDAVQAALKKNPEDKNAIDLLTELGK